MEKTKKRNSRKKTAAAMSVILIIALLITGTFAYFAAQSKVNQFGDNKTSSGGVGRDDYEEGGDGNKDVYVENPESSGNPLFARIRLDEYLDMLYTNDNFQVLVGGTKENQESWSTHQGVPADGTNSIPAGIGLGEGNDEFDAHDFWEWIMGGSKVYLPAPESEIPEDGTINTVLPYSDTKDDYVEGQEYDGITAKSTPVAEVITYEQWINDKEGKAGNFWVLSEDGWFYWANPIMPGSSTGLLLDAVNLDESKLPDEWKEYYYAINVLFEFWDNDEEDWNVNYSNADTGGKAVLDAAKTASESEKIYKAALDRLNALIAQGNEIKDTPTDASDYVQSGTEWNDFVAQLTRAEDFRDGVTDTTTAEQINAKADALEAAIEALKAKEAAALVYTALDKAISDAEALTPGDYIEEDQQKLAAAITAANTARDEATTQKEIDDAVTALNNVVDGLTSSVLPTKTPADPEKGFVTKGHETDGMQDYNIRYNDWDGVPTFSRAGAVFLKDVLDIDDVTGVSIEIVDAADQAKFGDYVTIGMDPIYGIENSILLSYIPTAAEIEAINANPEYTIKVKLTKGSQSATVKITMAYSGVHVW